MLIIWTLFITATSAHKVFESTEDIGPEAFQNVTTLYPVSKNIFNKTNHENIHTNIIDNNEKNNVTDTTTNDDKNLIKDDKTKVEATVWKIEAAFAESNLDRKEDHGKENETGNATEKKNNTKEFRPSPHLGTFFDEDSQLTPTKASYDLIPVRTPSSGFVSNSFKDEFRSSFSKVPKQLLQTHKQYPYKFDSPILTRLKDPWRHQVQDILESRPTVEVPVKVPAGGFYKYEDPFKEKPGNDDEDYGLGFSEDGKEGVVKKRVNPWENFIQLVTAFLPVGLIISALTPSLITVEDMGPGPHRNHYPSNMFRRSDTRSSDLPVISERCRRRLLCELHSEQTYHTPPQKSPPGRGKQCYKIRCEDPEALARTLRWLLEYKQTHNRHYT